VLQPDAKAAIDGQHWHRQKGVCRRDVAHQCVVLAVATVARRPSLAVVCKFALVLVSLAQLLSARECPAKPWWALRAVVAQKVHARTGSRGRRVPACASLNEATFAAAPQTRFCCAMAKRTPMRTIPQPNAEVAVVEAVVRLIGTM
jgi:hypothetical protein